VSPRLWRAFPWDPHAAPGEPFSACYRPPPPGYHRFDLPRSERGVLYLAGSPEHAVGEVLQPLRNQTLEDADLSVLGHRLALVEVTLESLPGQEIADLCAPALLAEQDIRPDRIAARERRATQRIAADLLAGEWSGLRWWSVFFGEWHGTVLFLDDLHEDALRYGTPEPLHLDHSAVREAARLLGIAVYAERGG
jgi:hypothetical protein